ncbi:MAG: RNA polymerase factor sigma-54 [Phycisphaerae bacterium]|jgi:RNA polymerase sigma-54 factor
MALEFQLTGQLRQELQMRLTPAMLQSMEILQLPLLALEQKILTELSTNPVLEIAERADEDEQDESESAEDAYSERELVISDDDTGASFERLEGLKEFSGFDFEDEIYRPALRNDDHDAKMDAFQNTADQKQSLQDFLLEQLALVKHEAKVISAGEYIIRNLDKRGFLNQSLEEIADSTDFTLDTLTKAHKLVTELEPAGIGARSIKECLLLQILQDEEAPDAARDIIEKGYELLIENHLPQLAKKVGRDISEINDVIKYLARLDTSPGLLFGSQFENAPVKADVIVEYNEEEDEYSVRLASGSGPALKVSDYYETMAHDKQVPGETRKYLQENIRSARWLIDAIAQRRETLLKISTYIVNRQRDYFTNGRIGMKPLSMNEIADYIGVHVATVSRAVSGKYAQCPNGIIALREFFSTGTLETSGDGDETLGTESARETLRKIIENEDKTKPLSDEKLCSEMEKEGIKIARRTVAKYREQLSIPSARMRKRFD